jgi:glycosyltransferase involved in cell wall biosynthesis
MEDAMLEEEDTILGNEDRSIASEERPQPASGSGAVLLSEDSSVPLNGGAAAVKEGAASKQVAPASADGSLPASRGKLLIVIPAYNEGGRVGAVVADVRQTLPDADVVVIDDGSEDATPAEAAAAGAVALSLPANCGYGIALQTGYKYAVRHGYELVGQIDADGQHQAEFLSAMLDVLDEGGADVVVGSRFLAKDGHYPTPFGRSLGIRLFARLASLATGHVITDPTSGFQVMRAEIARLFSSDVFPVDYPDADILILLHRTGYRVREVPVQMRPSPGRSMHSTQSTPYYVYKMLLSILVTLMRPRAKVTR